MYYLGLFCVIISKATWVKRIFQWKYKDNLDFIFYFDITVFLRSLPFFTFFKTVIL